MHSKILKPIFDIETKQNPEKWKTICRNTNCENPISEARLCRECFRERMTLLKQMSREIERSVVG